MTSAASVVPADVSKALASGGPVPSGLSAEEQLAYEQPSFLNAWQEPELFTAEARAGFGSLR